MDIKTAMALRNYGINPHNKTQVSTSNDGKFGGVDFGKELSLNKTGEVGSKKQDFASMMQNIATESINTLQTAEKTAIDGMNGKADVQTVVEAMAQAEMTVKTVTAVRDKVIEAYQEILRMPV